MHFCFYIFFFFFLEGGLIKQRNPLVPECCFFFFFSSLLHSWKARVNLCLLTFIINPPEQGQGLIPVHFLSVCCSPVMSVPLTVSVLVCMKGGKHKHKIGLSSFLSDQMNTSACIVNEGRRKIGFVGRVQPWDEQQWALSVPSTFRQSCRWVGCIHKFTFAIESSESVRCVSVCEQ